MLRKTRPRTRVFGPEVPESVSPKSGVCLEVSEVVDLKVSKKTLFGHF